MAKFKRKETIIDAVQWKGTPNGVGTSAVEVYNFLTGENISGSTQVKSYGDYHLIDHKGSRPELYIKTPEGNMLASRGDWILKGESKDLGVRYWVNKPDWFSENYEAVTN